MGTDGQDEVKKREARSLATLFRMSEVSKIILQSPEPPLRLQKLRDLNKYVARHCKSKRDGPRGNRK